MKVLMHVWTPHAGLIDAFWCTGAVCDGQPAGGWVYPLLPPALSLCILTFSQVLRAASPCCCIAWANILILARGKQKDCFDQLMFFMSCTDWLVWPTLPVLFSSRWPVEENYCQSLHQVKDHFSTVLWQTLAIIGWFFCDLFNFARH